MAEQVRSFMQAACSLAQGSFGVVVVVDWAALGQITHFLFSHPVLVDIPFGSWL
jgi:hypothetical protein